MENTISSLQEEMTVNKGEQDRGFQQQSLQNVATQAALDAGAKQDIEQNALLLDQAKKVVQQDEALDALQNAMQRSIRGERVARGAEFSSLESQIAELMSDQVVSNEMFKIEMESWENDVVKKLEDVQHSVQSETAGGRKVLNEVQEAVDTARALGGKMDDVTTSLESVQKDLKGLEDGISDVNKNAIAMCTLAEAKVIAEAERAKAAESDIHGLLDEAANNTRGEIQELCADMKLNEEIIRAEVLAEVTRLDSRCEDLQDSSVAKEKNLKREIDGILLRSQDDNEAFKVETRDNIQAISLNVDSFKTSLSSTMKALETSSQVKSAQVQQNVESTMVSFRHEMDAKIGSIQDELQSSIADSRLFEELVAIQFDEQATNAAPQLREKAQALHKQMDFLKSDFKDALQKSEETLRAISREQASALQEEADDRKIKLAKVEQRLEDLIRAEADDRSELLNTVKIELRSAQEEAEGSSGTLTEKLKTLQEDIEADRSARDSADDLHKIAINEDLKLLKSEVEATFEEMKSKNKDDMESLENEVQSHVQAETDMRQKMETSVRNELISEFANREQMIAGLAAEMREENRGLWVSKEAFQAEIETLQAATTTSNDSIREGQAHFDESLKSLPKQEDLDAIVDKLSSVEQKILDLDAVEAAGPDAASFKQEIESIKQGLADAVKADDFEQLSKKQAEDIASLADIYVPQEKFSGTVEQIVEIPQLWRAVEEIKGQMGASKAGNDSESDMDTFKAEMVNVVEQTDKKITDLKAEIQAEMQTLSSSSGFKEEMAQLESSMNRVVSDLSAEMMAESVVKQEIEDKVNILLQQQAAADKPIAEIQSDVRRLSQALVEKADSSALTHLAAEVSTKLNANSTDAASAVEQVKSEVSREMHLLKTDSDATATLLSDVRDSIGGLASKDALKELHEDVERQIGDLNFKDHLEDLRNNTAKKSDVEALKSQQELMLFSEQPTAHFATNSDMKKLASDLDALQEDLAKMEVSAIKKAQAESITASSRRLSIEPTLLVRSPSTDLEFSTSAST